MYSWSGIFFRVMLLILSFILIYNFTHQPHPELREGDLLFQNLNCGALCDAIETVTEGVDGKDFSHCGIVVELNDSLKVIEAIGDVDTTLGVAVNRTGIV